VFSWRNAADAAGRYGFASAVEAWIKENPDKGMPFLQELYREWPFFAAVVEHGHVLAKSSIAIASRYAELGTGR